MGCDIHIYIEFLDTKDGKWKVAAYDEKTGEATPGGPINITVDNGDDLDIADAVEEMIHDRFQLKGFDRSYVFFAKLASVRNSWSITPLASPRGLPRDVNSFIRTAQRGHHSETYFTPEELLAADWRVHGVEDEFISLEAAEKHLATHPDCRCYADRVTACYSGDLFFCYGEEFHRMTKEKRRLVSTIKVPREFVKDLGRNGDVIQLLKMCRDLKATGKSWRVVIGFDS